jgi:hypothetical protein
MARRAAPDEQPYRPLLDPGLVSAALSQVPTPAPPPAAPSKVMELTRPVAATAKVADSPRIEPARRIEQIQVEQATPHAAGPIRDEGRATQGLVEKFDQEKRILFTRGETQAIDRLVTSLAGRLNAQVKVSHVIRALVALLLHADAEIDKRAGEAGPLVRPPNGDALALQRFELEIARILAAGMRDAGPIR